MKEIRSAIDISASAGRVWDILVDLPSYPSWNPFSTEAESTLRVGDPITLHVRMRPSKFMVRVERVCEYQPPRSVGWDMQVLTPWLLASTRIQTVEPMDGKLCRYTTVNRFRGLLVPLVLGLYGADMQRGFDDVAKALKARAESV